MEISRKLILEIPGVYLVKNTESGKMYVGSSFNPYQRLMVHRSYLRKGNHQNRILQSSWNFHGEAKFECEALQYCSKEDLTKEEQRWIDELIPEFNITRQVERNVLSQESRRMISDTLKRRYREGMPPTRITPVDVYNLKGELLHEFKSVNACSTALKVNKTNISAVLSGKYAQLRGFVFCRKGVVPQPYKEWDYAEVKKQVELLDVKSGSILQFESWKEASDFIGVLVRSQGLIRGIYKMLPVPLKPGELREKPQAVNPEPSQMNDKKVVWKVQRIEVEESTNNTSTSARLPQSAEDEIC